MSETGSLIVLQIRLFLQQVSVSSVKLTQLTQSPSLQPALLRQTVRHSLINMYSQSQFRVLQRHVIEWHVCPHRPGVYRPSVTNPEAETTVQASLLCRSCTTYFPPTIRMKSLINRRDNGWDAFLVCVIVKCRCYSYDINTDTETNLKGINLLTNEAH